MKKTFTTLLLAGMTFLSPNTGFTGCDPKFINLVEEPCWSCMFPVTIGDISVVKTDNIDTPSSGSNTRTCTCESGAGIKIPGIKVSFWEPYRLVESVLDPGCFTTVGMEMSINPGEGQGVAQNLDGNMQNEKFFAQAHWIVLNIWYLLELYKDFPCLSTEEYDVAYFTEIDPLWQDDMMSMVINPEVLIFGNPILGMACIADSIAAATSYPRNELFWCMGNWASAYPLTGSVNTAEIPKGNAAVAGRLAYKMAREGLLCDHNIGEGCNCVHTPIWQKANFRFQAVRPKANTAQNLRIGQPTVMWDYNVTDPQTLGHENFAWIVWRKNTCCTTYMPMPGI